MCCMLLLYALPVWLQPWWYSSHIAALPLSVHLGWFSCFFLLASVSLAYLFKLLGKTVSLCLAVSKAWGMGSLLYFVAMIGPTQCTDVFWVSLFLFTSSFRLRHNSSQESAPLAASSAAHTFPSVSAVTIYNERVISLSTHTCPLCARELTAPPIHCSRPETTSLPHTS